MQGASFSSRARRMCFSILLIASLVACGLQLFSFSIAAAAEGFTATESCVADRIAPGKAVPYSCKIDTDAARTAVTNACRNNSRFILWIGAEGASQPSVQFLELPPNPTTGSPTETCRIQYCAQHRQTDQTTKWVCTSERPYTKGALQTNGLKRDDMIGTFGHSVIDDRSARTGAGQYSTLGQTATNLPPEVVQAIAGARDGQIEQLTDATSQLTRCTASETVLQCAGSDGVSIYSQYAGDACAGGQSAEACATALAAERERREQLAAEAQRFATNDRGEYTGVVNTSCRSSNCSDAENGDPRYQPRTSCDNGGNPPECIPPTTDRCSRTPRPPDCETTFRQCPPGYTGTPPTCQPARDPYGGLFGGQNQQCSGIQQMMSTCRNPYTGQQQCTGIALMTNNCPQGSYNPNNPYNPNNLPQPTCTITANPTNISAAGQAVTLTWQSQYAQFAQLSNTGQIPPSGTMTVYPQGATTYQMTVTGQPQGGYGASPYGYNQGYGSNMQGQCQTQVTIGNQTGQQPTAQISCQPQTADIGMQVGISFACQNASSASGSGFSTNGALSGSATTTVTSPASGQYTVTYGLTCSNQGQTHSAQCTVNVNKVALVLVANPKSVKSGEETNIGWVTSGMNSCVVSSPDNQSFTDANKDSTNVSGSAKSGKLTATTRFVLKCDTKTGTTKTATTTVTIL